MRNYLLRNKYGLQSIGNSSVLMKKIINAIVLLSLLSCFMYDLRAQNREGVAVSSSIIKEGTIIDSGFISTFQQEGKYYLIVPESALDRDILVTITIQRGSAYKERDVEMRFGYGGDSVFEKLIRIIRNRNNIEIINPKLIYQGRENSIYSSYLKSLEGTVITSAPIIENKDSGYVIDITDMMKEDSELFSLRDQKISLSWEIIRKISHIHRISKAFPENINFTSVRYYTAVDNKDKKDGGELCQYSMGGRRKLALCLKNQ